MTRLMQVRVWTGFLAWSVILMLSQSAQAAGTRPTYLKNGTSDPNVAFWVDNSGRGLRAVVGTTDGRNAQIAAPEEVVAADQTNLFDEPTLRVYKKNDQGQWVCVHAKHVSYISIPIIHDPDPNSWRWTGNALVPN